MNIVLWRTPKHPTILLLKSDRKKEISAFPSAQRQKKNFLYFWTCHGSKKGWSGHLFQHPWGVQIPPGVAGGQDPPDHLLKTNGFLKHSWQPQWRKLPPHLSGPPFDGFLKYPTARNNDFLPSGRPSSSIKLGRTMTEETSPLCKIAAFFKQKLVILSTLTWKDKQKHFRIEFWSKLPLHSTSFTHLFVPAPQTSRPKITTK